MSDIGLELMTPTSRLAPLTRASQAPQSLKPNKVSSHPSVLPKSQVPTQRALALSNLVGFVFLISSCNILLRQAHSFRCRFGSLLSSLHKRSPCPRGPVNIHTHVDHYIPLLLQRLSHTMPVLWGNEAGTPTKTPSGIFLPEILETGLAFFFFFFLK